MTTGRNVQHLKMKPVMPAKIRAKASTVSSGKSFGVAMAGVETAGGMLGASPLASSIGPTTNAGAVLAAAFGGVNAGMGAASGGFPSYAGGVKASGMYGMGIPGMEGVSGIPGSTGTSVVPGTEGFTQWDMINSMNQNNLQLLELQAMMQSNLQSWNTRSNILNADHRAKMAMVEKLSPR